MRVLGAELSAEGDAWSRFPMTLLGRNQDDTVGRTCAVDGRGARIFQDVDGFDVVRVEVVHPGCLGLRDSVDHDQRRVVAYRVDAADGEVHLVAARWVVVACLDNQVGRRSLKGLLDVGDRPVRQVFPVYGGNGRGDVTPCRRSVADDDYFVQVTRVFGHGHRDFGLFADRLHDCLVAEVDELQVVGVLDALDEIGSVCIGSRTVDCAFNEYGHPD